MQEHPTPQNRRKKNILLLSPNKELKRTKMKKNENCIESLRVTLQSPHEHNILRKKVTGIIDAQPICAFDRVDNDNIMSIKIQYASKLEDWGFTTPKKCINP